ncbi:MAG: peptide-methionine (S)-S-oxide reductase [Actinobacteria bacterium]|nr:peptide-methionine (S)-S-oxide reductase [Actinomycetota bacterium]
MGYTGGSTVNPTYYRLGDHTESVQIDFGPARVTYEELVEMFFGFHDPTRSAHKRQYMSAIFVHNPDQERVVGMVASRVQGGLARPIQTQVLPLEKFYLAEDYHQKYALQGDRLLAKEFRAMYPGIWDLVDSTAAMRVNAYLYGYGSAERLASEIDGFGLSEAGKARLRAASPAGKCPVV